MAPTDVMLGGILFFLLSAVAAIFGFSGLAKAGATIAKILFAIFFILFLLTILFGVIRVTPSPPTR